jgi:broad specificity phosphatase PhoE
MDAYEGTEEEQQYLDVVENLGLPELREWCAMSIENEELPELKEESAEESSKDVEAPEDTQSEESYADIDEELDNVVGRRRRRSK